MGRKEKEKAQQARAKQKLEKKLAKREKFQKELFKEDLELETDVVLRPGGEPRRGEAGRERRRLEKLTNEIAMLAIPEPEQPPPVPPAAKGCKGVVANLNRLPRKPLWKTENDTEREPIFVSHPQVQVVKKEELKLHDIFRPEEIRTFADFINGPICKESTFCLSNPQDFSVSFVAVALNRFDLIQNLLKDGSFFADYSKKGGTPLACAAITENWDVIEYLAKKDEQVHDVDKFGNTPLLQACLASNLTEVVLVDLWRILIQNDPKLDIASANKSGITLVHALAWRGWVEVLDQVLPLYVKTEQEKYKLSNLVNAKMNDGTTPLMIASMRGFPNVANLLILRGASLSAESKIGCTPLCYAIDSMFLKKDEEMEHGDKLEILGIPSLTPTIEVIITAMNDVNSEVDFSDYTARRLHLLFNPPIDERSQFHSFCRIQREVFIFISKFMEGGLKMLLEKKIFHKIAAGGQKQVHHSQFVNTLCGILFDILIYCENDRSLYGKASDGFLRQGAASFCLNVIVNGSCNTCEGVGDNGDCEIVDRLSSVSSVNEHYTPFMGMTDPKSTPYHPLSKPNNAIAAYVILIQLIDSRDLDHWLKKNFQILKDKYQMIKSQPTLVPRDVLNCSIDLDTLKRTNQKIRLFELEMEYEEWTPIEEVVDNYINNINPNDTKPSPVVSKKALKKQARKDRLLVEKNNQLFCTN